MKSYIFNIIIIAIGLVSINALGQDKIILKTGETIEAKVLEIDLNTVKYKKINNLEGPTFVSDKNEIHMIMYESGENEIFENDLNQNVNSESQVNKYEKKFGKNRFEASFGGVGYASTNDYDTESIGGFFSAVSYERILDDSGLLGLKLKGDVGYTEYDWIIMTFGVALNIYPFKNAKWLYVGPSVKYGAILFEYYYDYLYDDYLYDDVESYLGLGLGLGSQFQINRLFGIRLGLEYFFVKVGDSDIGDLGEAQIQLGFNFSF